MIKYLARLNEIIQRKPIPTGDGRRVFGIDRPPYPGEVEVEERKGMAMGGVPAAYADAWARLQIQKPMRVSDAEWRTGVQTVIARRP